MTATATALIREHAAHTHDEIPLSRIVRVELRKMFDTRSGFWLLASIVIAGLLATVATIAFAPDDQLTYYTFAKAIGFPMTVVLPIIAILAITGEWSQRTGLTTFTLVPHRSRVIRAKTISSVSVAVASMLFAFVLGAVGNVVGSAIAGTPQVWDMSVAEGVNIVLGNLLCLLTGTMLGMLIRSSPEPWSSTSSTRCCCPPCPDSSQPARSGSGTCSRGSTSTTPKRPSSRGRSPGSSGPMSSPPRRSGWSCPGSPASDW